MPDSRGDLIRRYAFPKAIRQILVLSANCRAPGLLKQTIPTTVACTYGANSISTRRVCRPALPASRNIYRRGTFRIFSVLPEEIDRLSTLQSRVNWCDLS